MHVDFLFRISQNLMRFSSPLMFAQARERLDVRGALHVDIKLHHDGPTEFGPECRMEVKLDGSSEPGLGGSWEKIDVDPGH